MKKTKVISLLLSLSLLAALVVPGTLAVQTAANDGESEKKGMEISKTATANDDGTYTITLEAYATGEKFITEVTEDIPTDIVLVLDQSGSMDENMHTYAFRAYTDRNNNYLYGRRHDGNGSKNLYYPLSDGGYAEVSVVRKQGESSYTYTECPASWTNSNYYSNRNNLFIKVGEEYQKVTLKRTGGWLSGYTYTYTFPNGIFESKGKDTSPGDFDGRGPLYVRSTTQGDYTYTYTYTDKDGVTQTIGSSTGENTVPTEFTLYERYSASTVTRLKALETAVTNFANSVSEKAAGEDDQLGTPDDVDHRIAVVGYASRADSNNPWINTELFIGATQHNYNVDAKNYYNSAFQDMSTTVGQDNVKASIGALDANGATYTNYGLEMANGILDAYPVEGNQKRNRVIILFTDGYPGRNADDFNQTAADTALTQATKAKNAGVSLYSVGIFDGADATSAGDKNGTNTQAANWFMQQVSSNNGTPQNPSYYLSASDADTLNNIFEQIADNIESGGSSTTLDSSAVIKDFISPQFQLPAGTTSDKITLETYSYTGENQWSKNTDAMGATATVEGDQVSVDGFDFKENWCGTETTNGTTTYRGNKLVISFDVVPKDGFLGGNGVYTNASAGVYENSSAEIPAFVFDRPQVDVAIKDVTVNAPDKDVYLLQDVPVSTLKNDTTAKVGDVTLDLTMPDENWGLGSWQNEYVNITVEIKDKDGKVIADDLADLTEDSEYTVSVKVSPKTMGKATEKSGEGKGNINVFKPTLTYKDSEVYYGDYAPTDFSGNLVSTKWLHNGTEADTTKMGTAPVLNATYTPDASKIDNGKINSKQDVPVAVGLKIGGVAVNQFVTFEHQACDPVCGWTTPDPNNGTSAFLLHVKTCQLTVTKTGGADGEPYVFTVKKDNVKYSEVTIVGNGSETIYELPVGTYTIEEDTGWSWRFNPSYSENVNLSKDNTSGTITCTNTKDTNKLYWLNGYSVIVENIFGESHNK